MFVGVVDGSKARPVWLTEVSANLGMEVVLILPPVGVVYLAGVWVAYIQTKGDCSSIGRPECFYFVDAAVNFCSAAEG